MTQLEEAVKFHRHGEIEEAKKLYLEVLEKEPNNASALNLYGVLLLQSAKPQEALEKIKKAVEIKECAPFLENLGLAYFCVQDFFEAANSYEKAFEKEPTIDTVQQLVKCYETMRRYEEAAKYCKMIHESNPDNIDIIRQLAGLYNNSKMYPEALDMYKKSLEIEPNDSIGLNNAGLLAEKLSDLRSARSFYVKSLKVKENYEALHNLGVLCRKERKLHDSVKLLEHALTLQPDNIKTKTSLGMTYFTLRDFKNGTKYYCQRNPSLKQMYKNEWMGEKHPDSTLLIYFEGGHGDQLMFCRYIKYVQSFFKKIILLVYPDLLELFKTNFPHLQVQLVTDTADYDYSKNIMELHYALNMDFDHIPSCASYLKADDNKIISFKQKHFSSNKRKIGVFWQGNPKVFKNRAIRLEQMKPLFNLSNSEFYSFQKDDKLNQIKDFPNIVNLEPDLHNFSDTAGALMNLDVLITIDTAIAHLAGALGVKTVLMLPYACEWRWFDETKTTQWYPNVEIFRQTEHDNWENVVEQVNKSLFCSK